MVSPNIVPLNVRCTEVRRTFVHNTSFVMFFCHNAARTHLVKHLGGKVVVDGEAEPVILLVVYLVLAERHVADGKVEEAGAIRETSSNYV